ncbi:MAG TPA: hypothetical protein VJB65_02900 [Patescibacteria group bacterium]|nr:hypothetical protein [Patescibacteria group bacterium]
MYELFFQPLKTSKKAHNETHRSVFESQQLSSKSAPEHSGGLHTEQQVAPHFQQTYTFLQRDIRSYEQFNRNGRLWSDSYCRAVIAKIDVFVQQLNQEVHQEDHEHEQASTLEPIQYVFPAVANTQLSKMFDVSKEEIAQYVGRRFSAEVRGRIYFDTKQKKFIHENNLLQPVIEE